MTPGPPDKNSTRKEYIEKCIAIVMNEGTTKNPSQAAAICYSMWHKYKKHSKGDQILEDALENLNDRTEQK